MFAIRNLKFRYFLSVLVQIAYQGMLIALIFLIKMVLYGYQPFDEFDRNDLLFFPNITSTNSSVVQTVDSHIHDLDLVYTDQHFALALDKLFVNSWYVFLVVLAIYGLLLFALLVQYALPTLRTRTILAFIPKVNIKDGAKGAKLYSLLICLNSEIHIFDFLYRLVCSIDQFHFSIILDELDISYSDAKAEEELKEVQEAKIEDVQAGGTTNEPMSKDDPADYCPKMVLSKSMPSASNCALVNPLYIADRVDQESRSRSHEVINMPISTIQNTLKVPVDVHQHLDGDHYSNDDDRHRSDYAHNPEDNPEDAEHPNNDQHSNQHSNDHPDSVHLDRHSDKGHHLDQYPSDVHHQDNLPPNNQVQ